MYGKQEDGIFSFTQQSAQCPQVVVLPDSERDERNNKNPRSKNRVNRAKTLLLQGKEPKKVDSKLFPALCDSLKNDYQEMVNSGRLRGSKRVYEAYKRSEEMYEDVRAKQKIEEQQKEIKERLNNAKQQKRDMIKRIEDTEKNMELYFEQEENDLNDRHQYELDTFNDEWGGDKKQRNYNKTSELLKLMRMQADKLLVLKQYQESAICEKRANQMEIDEINRKKFEMNADYMDGLKKLATKQENERRILMSKQKMKKTEFISVKNYELSKLDSRINKIEVELQKVNEPFYINKVKKSFKMTNSVNESRKKVQSRESRNIGKRPVNPSEFNEIPLPPLNIEEKVYRLTAQRKSNTISPRRSYY